ncbi:sigma-70 family RNA polymerase sigma factor [Aureitalea sp. L0-47]|uniref:RNA polymerase sigma factor n=1 Tax=Aureitalea sp. L0-47 TaxID=2816962 RepID=UPI002238D40A|nr:sigma-70 family RNA polymerase sigma factor [Aureitalea sp. L0-47]MCW5520296.1 sigma-70 family RNA polymerase sigma factor [Aureitalea sp. L0-47]
MTSDSELISLLKGNKASRNRAMEAIYRANRDIICAYVVSNSGTEAEATDLFQDCMIQFYDAVKKGVPSEDSAISAQLYSIAKSEWSKRLNKKQISEPEESQSTEIRRDGLIPLTDEERQDQIREIIGLMGFDCKYILIECIYHKTPLKEIASEGNFANEQLLRNRKFECLKKLRELMVARPGLLKITESDE